MKIKEIKDTLKNSKNIQGEKLFDNGKLWKMNLEGEYKVMENKGKNNKTENLLIEFITEQRAFNNNVLEFNKKVLSFMDEQKEFNQEMKQDIVELKDRVSIVENKIDNLEHKVNNLESKVDKLEHKVDKIDQRVATLETLHQSDINKLTKR